MKININTTKSAPEIIKPTIPGIYKSVRGVNLVVLAWSINSGLVLDTGPGTGYHKGEVNSSFMDFNDKNTWEFVPCKSVNINVKY